MTIQARHISLAYGKTAVFKDLCLEIPGGEVVALLGRNGAGKSSLIKVLSGLLSPQQGNVTWKEIPVHNLSLRERALKAAYVPQQTVPQKLGVYDVLLLGRCPHLKGTPTKEDHALVQKILEEAHMTSLAFRPMDTLSGGEIQKVGLARAFVQNPEYLFLDEPTNHLDIKNQYEALEMVRRWAEEHQRGALVAMHDLSLALGFADKILLLGTQGVLAMAPPQEISPALLSRAYDCPITVRWIEGRAVAFPQRGNSSQTVKEGVCA